MSSLDRVERVLVVYEDVRGKKHGWLDGTWKRADGGGRRNAGTEQGRQLDPITAEASQAVRGELRRALLHVEKSLSQPASNGDPPSHKDVEHGDAALIGMCCVGALGEPHRPPGTPGDLDGSLLERLSTSPAPAQPLSSTQSSPFSGRL
ncbi:Fc.00g066100.m01.CDS01 [Cosmosporella sp. VM-42]